MDWIKKIVGRPPEVSGERAAAAWQRRYAKEPGGYAALLGPEIDPFKHWGKKQLPARDVERDLGYALELRYVDKEPQTQEALLRRGLEVARRLRDDKLCDQQPLPASCHLQLESSQAYARWLHGEQLDIDALQRAFDFAMQSVGDSLSDDDDYFAEGYALAAARIALVTSRAHLVDPALAKVGESSRAAAMRMREVLLLVASAVRSQEEQLLETARRNLEALFDVYRMPDPKTESVVGRGSLGVIRLELAILVVKMRRVWLSTPELRDIYAAVIA